MFHSSQFEKFCRVSKLNNYTFQIVGKSRWFVTNNPVYNKFESRISLSVSGIRFGLYKCLQAPLATLRNK